MRKIEGQEEVQGLDEQVEVKNKLLYLRNVIYTPDDYWIYVDGDWKNKDILGE